MDRRTLLAGSAAAGSLVLSSQAQARPPCIFGAIRWDARYCDTPGQPCYEEEQILGPAKWHGRAPLHTQVLGPNKIRFAPTQESFDAEIRAARAGGLSYWAYLMYGDSRTGVIDLNHSMMKGLSFHRASAIRSQMKYAMMVQTSTLGSKDDYGAAVSAVVELMHDGPYQTCLGGRPILYLYYTDDDLKTWWGADNANLRAALDAVRVRALSRGLGDPYIVVLTSPPEAAEAARRALSADAISIYATPAPPMDHATYDQLDQATQSYWESEARAAAGGVVPTVMIGWDPRPRKEHPPSWELKLMPAHPDMYRSVAAPTSAQFAGECQAAIRFVDAHANACRARLVLVYAWNEDSEGGPLEPTLGDPRGARLQALGTIAR
jgi:hypothetical protein